MKQLQKVHQKAQRVRKCYVAENPLQKHGIANIWPPCSRELLILEKICRAALAFPQLECKQTVISCEGKVFHSPCVTKNRRQTHLGKKRKSTCTPSQEMSGERVEGAMLFQRSVSTRFRVNFETGKDVQKTLQTLGTR